MFAIRPRRKFPAKYYLAAKEYLEILLKPFFCADPNTEAALNGMKTQCENAEKQQHGTTRKVDEMESQKRARDIIDELSRRALLARVLFLKKDTRFFQLLLYA